jgi:hypothetical protein
MVTQEPEAATPLDTGRPDRAQGRRLPLPSRTAGAVTDESGAAVRSYLVTAEPARRDLRP